MKDEDKTKEQLINELAALRQRNSELALSEIERKQAEEACQGSEEDYKRLFELLPIGITMLDMKGVILFCNSAVYKKGSYPEDEFVGKHFSKIAAVRVKDIPKFIRVFNSIVRGKIPQPFEATYQRKDGTSGWTELNIGLIKIGGQRRILVMQHDITERKRMEHNLKERLKELNCLYGISKIAQTPEFTLDELYLETANLLPQSWQYPEITGALIRVDDRKFKTENYRETEWKQCSDIIVHGAKMGVVEVSYLEERPVLDEGPFLKEERLLIDAIAERLGRITERRRMEEELGENEFILAEAQRLAYIGSWEYDLTSNTPTWSDEVYRIFGLEPKEIEATYEAYVDHIHPDDREMVIKAYNESVSNRTPYNIVHRLLQKDGCVKYVNHRCETFCDDDGKPIRSIGTIQDITERKQAEEAIRDSEERYRSLVNNVKLGILRSTPGPPGRVLEANPAMEEITGYSREELLAMDMEELYVHLEERKVLMEELASAKGTVARELRWRKRDGSEIVVLNRVNAVRDDAGKILYFDTIFEDITERRQAEERERQLQQKLNLSSRLASIGMLAAGVAHEINNPLTGILGFSERLLRKSTDEKARQDLERIYNEAKRASRVVINLLTFARRHESKKEYVDINDVLKMALELMAYGLETGNIEVTLDLASDPPKTMADLDKIEEVFLNIILNAEQAITEANQGGRLDIKTQKIKDYLRISFANDGPGIPAEQLDKVFDPFFTTREEKGGTGLGLSVCHGIVTEHGGRIYIKSKPGKGATFFVELPLTGEKTDEVKHRY